MAYRRDSGCPMDVEADVRAIANQTLAGV